MNEGLMNCHDPEKAAGERQEIVQSREQAFEVLQRTQALFPLIHATMIQRIPWWLHRFTDWERIAERAHGAALDAANAQAWGWRRMKEGIDEHFPCQCDACIARRVQEEEEAARAAKTDSCPHCGGTGQDPNNWPYDCPACRRSE